IAAMTKTFGAGHGRTLQGPEEKTGNERAMRHGAWLAPPNSLPRGPYSPASRIIVRSAPRRPTAIGRFRPTPNEVCPDAASDGSLSSTGLDRLHRRPPAGHHHRFRRTAPAGRRRARDDHSRRRRAGSELLRMDGLAR